MHEMLLYSLDGTHASKYVQSSQPMAAVDRRFCRDATIEESEVESFGTHLIAPQGLEGGPVQVALSVLIGCVVHPFQMYSLHSHWPLLLIAAQGATQAGNAEHNGGCVCRMTG